MRHFGIHIKLTGEGSEIQNFKAITQEINCRNLFMFQSATKSY